MKHCTCINSRKHRILIVLAVVLCVLCLLAFDSRLVVRKYALESESVAGNVRIALVTDLHSCRYGDGQRTLIDAIARQAPDVILLGGDIFDNVQPDDHTKAFLEGVSGEYPCYYVPGNHEYWAGQARFDEMMAALEGYGVEILMGDRVLIEVGGASIDLCGLQDPDAFGSSDKRRTYLENLDRLGSAADEDAFTVLLAHRPEYFEAYSDYDFDLVLCGHAHGGQWRIPGILNGVFAPDQGIFPKLAGGRYDRNDTTMIVSRGLARESTRIPRIFNRPELVIVEIGPRDERGEAK
ncbi:MAG: metallophosphoesterase [Clostridiales bacterium]|nr:metallophosphoesterase [Clostridiales bacterium]